MPVSGVGSSRPDCTSPPWPARIRPVIRVGSSTWRLAPEGRRPPRQCSWAVALPSAAGVGSSHQAAFVSWADGEDEKTRTRMGGAGGASAYGRPLRVIPQAGKVCQDAAEAPGPQGGDVLQVGGCGAELSEASGDVVPQATAGSFQAGSASGQGDVLR